MVFTLTALGLSNSPWAHDFLNMWETPVGVRIGSLEFARSLRDWIIDGLMTLFFLVVALELKRELILGELNSPRAFALPIAAALGGMLVPASLYLFLQWGQPGERGWGTVMATDTALVIGCLALLGSRIPQSLKVFMLSLAIVDDIGAILVVAIGYSGQLDWEALALGILGLAIVPGLARLRRPEHSSLLPGGRRDLGGCGCVRDSRHRHWRDPRPADPNPRLGERQAAA